MSANILVEACVDSVACAEAAAAGGAGRVELCAGLVEGGTTPSEGMIAAVRERIAIALHVLIRPRGGDFLYSRDECAVMRRDIDGARRSGANGVVLGALCADGTIDAEMTTALVEHAHPLSVTFHRAFDMTRDLVESLAALERMGIERVLTSGGAASARAGIPVLASLVRHAGDRVTILAGGGITRENVAEIVAETGVREVHVRGAVREESAMRYRATGVALSRAAQPDEFARAVTSADSIRLIALALERHQ